MLAALLAPTYGVYSGYELYEHVAVKPGSEEYQNSEKYAYRPRDWSQPEKTLVPYLTTLNRARREHPAPCGAVNVVGSGGGPATFNLSTAAAIVAAAIGVPLLIRDYGGDPAVVGAVGMLAGFCGTLMTPMAANFNLVPAALLELKDQYGVIKAQVATALPLLAFAASVTLLQVDDGSVKTPAVEAARYLSRHGIEASVQIEDGRGRKVTDIVRTVRGVGYRFDRHADVAIRQASTPSPDFF